MKAMQVTIDIPEDLLQHANPAREALEAYAIAGYRSGALSRRQTRELLGFQTGYELDGFLKVHNVFERSYGVKDLEHDLRGLGKLA